MEQNIDNKIDFKSRVINFYKENKIKIQIFLIAILISLISIALLQAYNEKKNNQIKCKFVEFCPTFFSCWVGQNLIFPHQP